MWRICNTHSVWEVFLPIHPLCTCVGSVPIYMSIHCIFERLVLHFATKRGFLFNSENVLCSSGTERAVIVASGTILDS